MAKQSLTTIKNWFKTRLKPTQAQFWDTWDSFWHKDDNIPVDSINGLNSILIEKASKEYVDNILSNSVQKVQGSSLVENAEIEKIHLPHSDDQLMTSEDGSVSISATETGFDFSVPHPELQLYANNEEELLTAWEYAIDANKAARIYITNNIIFTANRQFVNLSSAPEIKIEAIPVRLFAAGNYVIDFNNLTLVNIAFRTTGDFYFRVVGGVVTLQGCYWCDDTKDSSLGGNPKKNIVVTDPITDGAAKIILKQTTHFTATPDDNNSALIQPFWIENQATFAGDNASLYIECLEMAAVSGFERFSRMLLTSTVADCPYKVTGDESWFYAPGQEMPGHENIKATANILRTSAIDNLISDKGILSIKTSDYGHNGLVRFLGEDGLEKMQIAAGGYDHAVINTSVGVDLVFRVGENEKVRINSVSGNIGVNTPPSQSSISLKGNVDVKGGVINTGDTVTCFGDSITAGERTTIAYANLIAEAKGWTITNKSKSGCELGDFFTNIYGTTICGNSNSFILPGFNDMRHWGANPDSLLGFKRELYSALAWLSIPTSRIIQAQSTAITYSAGWLNTSNWGILQKYSETNGATATFKLYGKTILIDILQFRDITRGVNVTIDGVDCGTYNGSTYMPTAVPVDYAPFLIRIPNLTDVEHTVVLTVTDGTQQFYFNWAVGVSGNYSETMPNLYVGNTLRMTTTGYASTDSTWDNGSDDVVWQFNDIIENAVRDLSEDGLNIAYVDACSHYNPIADVTWDDCHPSEQGHTHIADAFLSVMNSVAPARGRGLKTINWRNAKENFRTAGKVRIGGGNNNGEPELIIERYDGINKPVTILIKTNEGSPGIEFDVTKIMAGFFGGNWTDVRLTIQTPNTTGVLIDTLTLKNGMVSVGDINPTSFMQVAGIAEYADNTTAITAGLTHGAFYRTGDFLKIVH